MKNSRAHRSDLKMQKCIDFMKKRFSTTEFRSWNSREVSNNFQIGANFAVVLESMGYIKRERGSVMLTSKFETIRPSTIRKNMTKLQKEYLQKKSGTATGKRARRTLEPTTNALSDLNQIFISIREKIRQDVINEIKTQLANNTFTIN